jgi:uncharacterized OB-fold protein
MSAGITFQRCAACGHVQYFARSFCAACGARDPIVQPAGGEGVVYSMSLVHRAPTPDLRDEVPYMIVLVDMAEGFRMMAHGETTLTIGDRVVASTRAFAGKQLPYFRKG